MISALGVIIGLAARAPLTFFDEPYLGLDAVARQLFYDRLLADYAEHPRTVVLSTHLIDEVGDLIEHVLLLDRGRLVLDEDAEELRGQVVTATGPAEAVDGFAAGRRSCTASSSAALVRVDPARVVRRRRTACAPRSWASTWSRVSLQQAVVRLTSTAAIGKEGRVLMNRVLDVARLHTVAWSAHARSGRGASWASRSWSTCLIFASITTPRRARPSTGGLCSIFVVTRSWSSAR